MITVKQAILYYIIRRTYIENLLMSDLNFVIRFVNFTNLLTRNQVYFFQFKQVFRVSFGLSIVTKVIPLKSSNKAFKINIKHYNLQHSRNALNCITYIVDVFLCEQYRSYNRQHVRLKADSRHQDQLIHQPRNEIFRLFFLNQPISRLLKFEQFEFSIYGEKYYFNFVPSSTM